MFLFGYEHALGYGPCPSDDEVFRLMIFPATSNNVMVWRGINKNLTIYTLDSDIIWEIEGLLEEQKELSDAEKSGKEYVDAIDAPSDEFVFYNGEGRLRNFSDNMLFSEKGEDVVIDRVIDAILKIQEILRENGIDITMWYEDE